MVDSLMVVYGINTVMEALRAGRVRRLRVGPRADGRLERALEIARRTGIPIDRVDPSALEQASRGGVHQGVLASEMHQAARVLASLSS